MKKMPKKNTAKNHNKVFGFQLLLDLYDCKDYVCDDLDLCYKFLDEIVDDLKMKKQSPPSIFRSDADLYPEKAGLSGWVPLIESSVVIHTLSKKNFITIDIYTCAYFDTKQARKFCLQYFSPKKIDSHFIERGKDYYRTDTNYHTMEVRKGKIQNINIKGNPKENTKADSKP